MNSYTLSHITQAQSELLRKDVFIVLLHATRIPPHIGMLTNGFYHSLSVKGQDLDVPIDLLWKGIVQRKIPSLFIQIHCLSGSSPEFLSEAFKKHVKCFNRVDQGVATCLSPLKLFFAEQFGLSMENVNYLYELLPLLERKELIGPASGYGLEVQTESSFTLPYYTMDEILKGIEAVRIEYK